MPVSIIRPARQTFEAVSVDSIRKITRVIRHGIVPLLMLLITLAMAPLCIAHDQGQEGSSQGSGKDNTQQDATQSGWTIDEWQIQTSVYTHHWDPDPDHVNNQKLIGVEAVMENQWSFGLALFQNSFGQSSQYVYIGKRWALWGSDYWYFKVTGGLLHGYKEPHEDKIPLNGLGVAPAILPAFGFRYKYFTTELNIAGTAALTLTAGIIF
jgi:hypothetical protein